MHSLKKYKIKIVFGIFVLCISGFETFTLKAQNYFSKSNFHYLNQYSISGGVLVNQANHRNLGYKPNNKVLININVSAIRIKHFSLDVGIGFRKKSLIGYGNYPWLRLISNHEPIPDFNYPRYYKIDFSFLNADAIFKVTLLQKYKLQPFLFVGARYNKILRYSDSLDIYNKYMSSLFSFKIRDKYINSFYGIGCSYSINSYLNVHLIFEQNNDQIPGRQVYFNTNPQAKEKEIRFLSYSFQIGIQYTLPNADNKLKKNIGNKTE